MKWVMCILVAGLSSSLALYVFRPQTRAVRAHSSAIDARTQALKTELAHLRADHDRLEEKVADMRTMPRGHSGLPLSREMTRWLCSGSDSNPPEACVAELRTVLLVSGVAAKDEAIVSKATLRAMNISLLRGSFELSDQFCAILCVTEKERDELQAVLRQGRADAVKASLAVEGKELARPVQSDELLRMSMDDLFAIRRKTMKDLSGVLGPERAGFLRLWLAWDYIFRKRLGEN